MERTAVLLRACCRRCSGAPAVEWVVWIDASGSEEAARLLRKARGSGVSSELLGDDGWSYGNVSSNYGSLGAEREWRVRGKEEGTLAVKRARSRRGLMHGFTAN